jgi:hypothetical protein
MTVTRVALAADRLVYVICASRKLRYEHGRSPVAYIGTTRKGAERIAQSVSARAGRVLGYHGVTTFDVRVLTTSSRQNIKSWRMLERALLLEFRAIYGEVPKCNVAGKGISERSEFKLFARDRVRQILKDLEEHGMAPPREEIKETSGSRALTSLEQS